MTLTAVICLIALHFMATLGTLNLIQDQALRHAWPAKKEIVAGMFGVAACLFCVFGVIFL